MNLLTLVPRNILHNICYYYRGWCYIGKWINKLSILFLLPIFYDKDCNIFLFFLLFGPSTGIERTKPERFIICLSVLFFKLSVTFLFSLFAGTSILFGRNLSKTSASSVIGKP